MNLPPLQLTAAFAVPQLHLTLVGAADGTVHRLERLHGDMVAIYGDRLPALLRGECVRMGDTKHISITARAERSMG